LVEGKYDKIKLSSLVDALIIETNGFSVYKDEEKRSYIRTLAAERGLVILTDSDNAGRQIRNYVASFVPQEQIRHAYIPDIYGKEKRKAAPSKEGKLGVEGIPADVLLQALLDAGVAAETAPARKITLTTTDCMELGLTGHPNSSDLRKKLCTALGLPENMTLKMLQRWVDTEEKLSRMLRILENFEADA
ncbi:MAG: DUF4093 domain-containing protein, partial [Clostridia bacterium]|nr:DUF4093 domain-containing protein [Clostridia bacterium]